MDPNANLRRQEELFAELRRRGCSEELRAGWHRELDELRLALAEWLAKGGFEPDWSAAPWASIYFGKGGMR
jgi:hypothetical protein